MGAARIVVCVMIKAVTPANVTRTELRMPLYITATFFVLFCFGLMITWNEMCISICGTFYVNTDASPAVVNGELMGPVSITRDYTGVAPHTQNGPRVMGC